MLEPGAAVNSARFVGVDDCSKTVASRMTAFHFPGRLSCTSPRRVDAIGRQPADVRREGLWRSLRMTNERLQGLFTLPMDEQLRLFGDMSTLYPTRLVRRGR